MFPLRIRAGNLLCISWRSVHWPLSAADAARLHLQGLRETVFSLHTSESLITGGQLPAWGMTASGLLSQTALLGSHNHELRNLDGGFNFMYFCHWLWNEYQIIPATLTKPLWIQLKFYDQIFVECRIFRSLSLFGTRIVWSCVRRAAETKSFFFFHFGKCSFTCIQTFVVKHTSVVYCRQCSDAWSTAHTEFKPSSFLLVNTVNLHETHVTFACGNLFPIIFDRTFALWKLFSFSRFWYCFPEQI